MYVHSKGLSESWLLAYVISNKITLISLLLSSGPEVINFFMLNLTEHEISTAQ